MRRNKGLTFVDKKKVFSRELLREIFVTAFYCVAGIVIAIVLVVAFGMKTPVIGVSMEPGLSNSQEVLIDRFAFKLVTLSRNDIVCFYPKGNENSHIYVKRIVGMPGETVQIKDGYVYINGVRLLEDEQFDKIEDPGDAESLFALGANEYFVLGDNRNNSEDSRNGNIGAVNLDTIVGKAWFKLSINDNKFGFIK